MEQIAQDVNEGHDFLLNFNLRFPTRTIQYFSGAISAFVLYEYFLTLSDEVSRVIFPLRDRARLTSAGDSVCLGRKEKLEYASTPQLPQNSAN